MPRKTEIEARCGRLTIPTVCAQCGKGFERTCTGEWGYTRLRRYTTVYFCSWSCMRKYDSIKAEKEKKKHDRAIEE